MFAIPAHNAEVERIFSLIEMQWTDERNKLSIETIKNIIMVKFNFDGQPCAQFYQEMKNNEILLKKCRSSEKYTFLQSKNN